MRLIHTEPLNRVIDRSNEQANIAYKIGHAHLYLIKSADVPITTHALSGRLYLSKSGWLLLSVPNSLVRGAFDALNEQGVSLPFKSDGSLEAHISVMRPEELKQIGGPEKVTERGHHLHYTLGPVQAIAPENWPEMAKVWMIKVNSIELQNLRKSYGLSPLPNEGKFAFHITIGVKKKHVLKYNSISKASNFMLPLMAANALRGVDQGLKEKDDPATQVEKDDSYLDDIRSLVKKRKKKPVVVKEANTDRTAVIIKGNPRFKAHPEEEETFYNSLAEHLNNRGYSTTFDPGEPYTSPPDADLWVGHSRGADRLRFAPKQTLTFDTGPHEHEKAKVHAALQRELAKALGLPNVAALPSNLRTEPPVEHYLFTDEMRKALDDKLNQHARSVLANNNIVQRRLEDSIDEGKHSNLVGPVTLGAGLAGLGTAAALLLNKEGNNDGLWEMPKETESSTPEAESAPQEVRLQTQEDNDFSCDPSDLSAIYSYYGHRKQAKLGNGKFELSDLYQAPASWISSGASKVKQTAKDIYSKLEHRYGPRMAKIITGAGLIGAPIPGPGTSLITAAPFLAAGEISHAFKGNYTPPTAKEQRKEDQEWKEKKEKIKRVATLAAPSAGAGLLAGLLNKPTKGDIPQQVTKFPGFDTPRVIRGRISHNSPASTFEDTGNKYLYLGPKEFGDELGVYPWDRSHGIVNEPKDIAQAVKDKIKPDEKLELLELLGHGSPYSQLVGNSIGNSGYGDITKSINRRTVKDVANDFKQFPWSDKDPTFLAGGCNTGLCNPPPGSPPEQDWMKYLSDNANIRTLGSKGFGYITPGTGLNTRVIAEDRDNFAFRGDATTRPAKDNAYSLYQPNKPTEEIITERPEDEKSYSKQTYGAFSNTGLANALYNIGKPSAIAGSILAPLLSDKKKARTTAIAASALSTPMLLKEILLRHVEAKGKSDMGLGSGVGNYLGTQAKSLPYLALAGLPLLSYGAANWLGRWKKDKPQMK